MNELVFLASEYKPLVTIMHVCMVVIGMGGALIADVLFVFFAYNKVLSVQEHATIRLIAKVVLYALAGILLTGALLFLSDIEKYSNSVKFLTKMTVVTVLIINGVLLHKLVFNSLHKAQFLQTVRFKSRRRVACIFGAVSFMSWMSALSLGVLDSVPVTYTTAVSIYGAVLLVAILCSQLLFSAFEKKGSRRS